MHACPPLIRFEYPSERSYLWTSRLPVSGRMFIPQELTTSEYSPEFYVEWHGKTHGPYAVGLRFCAESLAISGGVQALSIVELPPQAEQTTEPGRWFAFSALLLLPPLEDSAPLCVVSAMLRTERGAAVSNRLEIHRCSSAAAQLAVWQFPAVDRRVVYGEVLTLVAVIASPVAHILRCRVEDSKGRELESAYGAAPAFLIDQFPDSSAADLTAIAMLIRREDFSATLNEPITIECELQVGSIKHYTIPAPLLFPSRSLPESQVESVRQLADGRVCIEGYALHEHTEASLEFFLRTARRTIAVHPDTLPGASIELVYREDLTLLLPSRTQQLPWGFRVGFFPDAVSLSEGTPQIEIAIRSRSESAAQRRTVGSASAYTALGQLMENRRADSSALELLSAKVASVAFETVARCKGVSKKLKVERSAKDFDAVPRRLAFAMHGLAATEGAPRVVFNLLKSIRKRLRPDAEMLLISGAEGELAHRCRDLGVRVEVLPQLHVAAESTAVFESEFRRALTLCAEFDPDILYANTIGSFWGVEIAHRLRIPCCWAIHESKRLVEWQLEVQPYYSAKIAECVNRARMVLFVADSTRSLLAPHTAKSTARVIPNGVDTDSIARSSAALTQGEARQRLGIDADAEVIAIIGTTTWRKGQDVFIREMAELARLRHSRKLCFLIVGARRIPFLAHLQSLAAEYLANKDVRFIAETPEVAEYFIAADVIAICSREESSPLVSLETFAYQRPLVSTTVFGLGEQLQSGVNALTFEESDRGGLARQVNLVLDDAALRQRLIAAGQQTLAQHYSLDRSMDMHWQAICELPSIST